MPLFDVKKKLVKLSKLGNFDFEDFKTCGNYIWLDSEKELFSYYRKIYNQDLSPFYKIVPAYNDITRSKEFRYIIVDCGEDTVLIVYKIIQIMTTKQIRFFNYPISLLDNRKNEDKVFDKIVRKDFVKFQVSIESLLDKFENVDRLYFSDDWYYDIRIKGLGSKYKSHHKINRINGCGDFSHTFSNSHDYTMSEMEELWDNWVDLYGGYVSNKRFNEYRNFLTSNNHSIYKSIIRYKGVPVSCSILYIHKGLKIAIEYYKVHMARDEDSDDEFYVDVMRHNISALQRYYIGTALLDEFNISRYYVLGADRGDSLRVHKETTCDDCIKYWLCDGKRR